MGVGPQNAQAGTILATDHMNFAIQGLIANTVVPIGVLRGPCKIRSLGACLITTALGAGGVLDILFKRLSVKNSLPAGGFSQIGLNGVAGGAATAATLQLLPADVNGVMKYLSPTPDASQDGGGGATVDRINGVAQLSAAGTVKLAASDTQQNGFYVESKITMVTGALAGQSRRVVTYNSGTKVANIGPKNWPSAPASGDLYQIETHRNIGAEGDLLIAVVTYTAGAGAGSDLLGDVIVDYNPKYQ